MRGFGEIAERLRRSTVQVRREGVDGGSGSGVVWSASGVVVTNAHVARGNEAQVELWDGRRFRAAVTSRDSRRDLAALRLEGASDVTPVEAGDSDGVRSGELVIAIGNPMGFAGALSTGVVHSVGPLPGMGRQKWIRADVQLAPGNSGGPLANAQGQVVGINTAIMNGLGVAAPSNAVAEFLRRGVRPSLGVVLDPVHLGLRIREIDRDGRAAAASLREGDILLGSFDDLSDAIDSGSEVIRVRFLRCEGWRIREAYVRLRERAEAAA